MWYTGNKQTTAQPLDRSNLSQQWTIEEQGTGNPVLYISPHPPLLLMNISSVHWSTRLTVSNSFHSAASPNDVLDLYFGRPENSTPVVVYTKTGATNQQWVLFLVSRDTVSDLMPSWYEDDQISLTINEGL